MTNCYHGVTGHCPQCSSHMGQAVCPQCAGKGCPHCQGKGYHLGYVTINKNTATGISIGSGIAGAILYPMLTGQFSTTTNTNRKMTAMGIGFAMGAFLGGLGSYAGYQIQN